jgi:hypothetical protein
VTRDTHAHVGHLAGQVYRSLERQGPMSVMDISIQLKLWPWDVLLALGWLMREDKVRLTRRLLAVIAELRK